MGGGVFSPKPPYIIWEIEIESETRRRKRNCFCECCNVQSINHSMIFTRRGYDPWKLKTSKVCLLKIYLLSKLNNFSYTLGMPQAPQEHKMGRTLQMKMTHFVFWAAVHIYFMFNTLLLIFLISLENQMLNERYFLKFSF